MKKYLFLYYGFVTPTKEIGDAWGKWFQEVGDKFVDSGSAFGFGREITKTGVTDLPLQADSLTGYSLINAESMEEATAIAKTNPMILSVKVYEADSM